MRLSATLLAAALVPLLGGCVRVKVGSSATTPFPTSVYEDANVDVAILEVVGTGGHTFSSSQRQVSGLFGASSAAQDLTMRLDSDPAELPDLLERLQLHFVELALESGAGVLSADGVVTDEGGSCSALVTYAVDAVQGSVFMTGRADGDHAVELQVTLQELLE